MQEKPEKKDQPGQGDLGTQKPWPGDEAGKQGGDGGKKGGSGDVGREGGQPEKKSY